MVLEAFSVAGGLLPNPSIDRDSRRAVEPGMKAYVVLQERSPGAGLRRVPGRGRATLAAHGGRFLVRGAALTVQEGEWPHPRLVVIEFPSREAAEGWYQSPAYQQLMPLRLRSTVGNLVIVDGA